MIAYLRQLVGMPPGRGSVGAGRPTGLPAPPKSLIPFAIIAAVIGGLVLAYKIAYPTMVYKYRMTVEVEVNGEIKSGSSVIEVDRYLTPKWLPGGGMRISHVYGDAVFVDLGSGRNVIAALYRPGSPVPAFPIRRRTAFTDDQMPTFVTFTDINEPKTLLRVSPQRFEIVLGSGIRLKDVYVEPSRDPITRSITQRLPWLKTLPRGWNLRSESRDADTYTELNIPYDLCGES
jgi:hypothetical protein